MRQSKQSEGPKAEINKPANKTNRLIREKSPYLLQHAQNPVDWYPWGEEAFEKAHREDKPVFLSIGYSTCHWCHVMEHESFNHEGVAKRMNQLFICIKVDREERPEIDNVYMTVARIMTGSGGWPLTIIMTPDKKPFFAGTYLPRESRHNRIGIMELMKEVEELWRNRRREVEVHADNIAASLGKIEYASMDGEPDEALLDDAFRELVNAFDKDYGGFGTAPKFPAFHHLFFLLRYWKRKGIREALHMVTRTLDEIRKGGIYDHIGFGIHRYSTDERWLVPHFEKMLYDQALYALICIETWQITKKNTYKKTTEEIFSYILRDMTSPEGGFFTAQDADSEEEEGRFYLWEKSELKKVLGEKNAAFICRLYNVEKKGNYIDALEGRKTGKNILHLQASLNEFARKENLTDEALAEHLAEIRTKLFNKREKRVHPYRDDKILTDWNGLIIAALAKGARVFNKPAFAKAAGKAARFILNKLRSGKGRLYHRYREGEAGIDATLDDYAFFIFGLIELYEATFDTAILETALQLQQHMTEHFADTEKGAFYMTADDGERLLTRPMEIYDGGVPSGNSVAMSNLLRLAHMTGDADMELTAAKVGRAFSKNLTKAPTACSHMLASLESTMDTSCQVVIAGKRDADDTKSMLQSLTLEFLPNVAVLLKDTSTKDPTLSTLAPFTKDYKSLDGKATAYVCHNFRCSLPVIRADEMLKLLREEARA